MKNWLKYFGAGAALTLSLALFTACTPKNLDIKPASSESGVVKAFSLVEDEGLISKTARAVGVKYRVTAVTATSVREYSIGENFSIENSSDLTNGKKAAAFTAYLADADTSTPASSLERAYAEALRLSGIAGENVAGFDFDRDTYMGKSVFKVEIEDAEVEYTYVFDAETFEVLSSKSELRNTSSGTDSSYIGEARAQEIALEAVGIDAAAAEGLAVKSILSDGRRVYKVSLSYGEYRYEADIDALSGEIVEFSKTILDGAVSGPEIAGNISEDEAKEIALQFAFPEGVGERTVTFRKVKLDYENGAFVYEVEFVSGGDEYELEIAAADGTVLDAEIERDDKQVSKPQESVLSREEATRIVEEQLGEKMSSSLITDVELETDDGEFIYEITVNTYTYKTLSDGTLSDEVDSITETVISVGASGSVKGHVVSQESHTIKNEESKKKDLIDEKTAIEIALEHFSLTAKEARIEKVKLEKDDGMLIYEIEFKVKNLEYEVEIDAKTGKILESDISYD